MPNKYFAPFLALIIPAYALASPLESPSRDEARGAIHLALSQKGKKDESNARVREVLDCYPVTGDKPNERICLLEVEASDRSAQIQALRFRKSRTWELMMDGDSPVQGDPACPSKALAEPILRESLHDAQLVATPTDQEGLFSDERGHMRDKTGPLRLMCTYSVKGVSGEATVVGYFRFQNGKYTLDPDREIWSD